VSVSRLDCCRLGGTPSSWFEAVPHPAKAQALISAVQIAFLIGKLPPDMPNRRTIDGRIPGRNKELHTFRNIA
jgi:hypothetical protein